MKRLIFILNLFIILFSNFAIASQGTAEGTAASTTAQVGSAVEEPDGVPKYNDNGTQNLINYINRDDGFRYDLYRDLTHQIYGKLLCNFKMLHADPNKVVDVLGRIKSDYLIQFLDLFILYGAADSAMNYINKAPKLKAIYEKHKINTTEAINSALNIYIAPDVKPENIAKIISSYVL